MLALPSIARTEHFSLHAPSLPKSPVANDLPTAAAPDRTVSVDNQAAGVLLVVPKRHAKRAVTRNMIKRQMRAAASRHGAARPLELLIRLRQPFGPRLFPSATSTLLVQAVRRELDELFARCTAGPR